MNAAAEIGVIGGSGLYALLEEAEEFEVSTPYGAPSDPITVAEVGGRRVALPFVCRDLSPGNFHEPKIVPDEGPPSQGAVD